ncbi:MAG: hypothetical protein AAGD13_01600 [Pseudomonadota bacterium]
MVESDAADERTQTVLNALAAIRCSMEILRDTADISSDERIMFAEMALAEEARVESLFLAMMADRETES